MNDQSCPICRCSVPLSNRYPKRICGSCLSKAVNAEGKSLSFSNTSPFGGFVARIVETGQEHTGHVCFIDGVACWAEEARFGGIVVQPLPPCETDAPLAAEDETIQSTTMVVVKSETSHVKRLADAYYKLLSLVDWQDNLLVAGLKEGLNKFLSNAFISLYPGIHKYHRTHFVSHAALTRLCAGEYHGLIYEHLVPKSRYIQQPCQELAKAGKLMVQDVEALLGRYWRLATVTELEDQSLQRTNTPDTWDGTNVLARYEAVGIELIPNPYFPAEESAE